jgi:GT2 family glycosyltransferase
MLVVRLTGGLGNQLFQVAFAHRLVQLGHTDVVLDTSAFRFSPRDVPRRVEIDREVAGLRMIALPPRVERLSRSLPESIHVREAVEGDDVISRVGPRARLITGYFQTWPLADHAREPMARVFAHHTDPMPSRPSFVALHSRLGDYLAQPLTPSFPGVTSPTWLVHTARALKGEVGADQIRVFTDSRRQFETLAESAGLDDLVFDESTQAWGVISSMQHAAGFVLSNSSLSWWAAFAARSFLGSDAPVIMPLPWLATPSALDSLLLGPGWRPTPREMVTAEQANAVRSGASLRSAPASGPRLFYRSELVLCTRNRVDDLRNCLLSVFAARCPPERILVVDSSDDDRVEQLVAALRDGYGGELEYVRGPSSLTLRRNVGLELLRPSTEIVHFLADDVIVDADYFLGIDAVFATDSATAGVGGRITGTQPRSASRLESMLRLSGPQGIVLRSGLNIAAHDRPTDTDVEHLSGSSMSYRVARIAGLRFDVRRADFDLGEDIDFSMRANTRGRLVWTPNALLEQHQGDCDRDVCFAMARAGVRSRWMLGTDRLGRVRRGWVVYATLASAVAGSMSALAHGDVRKALRYRAGLEGLIDVVRDRRRRSRRTGD